MINLFKKATLGLTTAALILTGLTGCIGEKEEFKKGIALYEKGDFDSLMKARKFFNEYAEKHPDDDDVNEWFAKIDKKLIEEAKRLTDEYYEKKDFKKALKYVTIAKEGDPENKDIQRAYNLVKKQYIEQKEYDKFVNYLEDRYIQTKEIINQWDLAIKSIETGKNKLPYIQFTAQSIYPKVVELRERVNTETFAIKGKNAASFREINSILFEYVIGLERQLSEIMNFKGAQNVDDFKDLSQNLSPESFNNTFLRIQDEMSNYVKEKDMEGKRKREIKDTLNFAEAYRNYEKEKERKAAEEAAKQQQQQQILQQSSQQSTPQQSTPSIPQKPGSPTKP